MKTILLLSLLSAPALAKEPAVGSKAINFTLNRFNGEKVTLSDLRGKVVLLDFWASWCAPCREEMPMLDILQKTYAQSGFEIVAVNIDNRRKNALDFLEQHRIKLLPVWDEKKEVVTAYDVDRMPTNFILDRRGWIRFVHSGFKAENFQDYKRQIETLLQEGRRKRVGQENG